MCMIACHTIVPLDYFQSKLHDADPSAFIQCLEGTKTSVNEHTLAERVPHNSVQTYDFQRRKNPNAQRTQTHIHLHTRPHTLSNPLIHPCLLHSLPCCWRHRSWSTDARKFPFLILLTFTATQHFSAWCYSTHSVTDEALLASAETSLGASTAHRSDFWLITMQNANTSQNYETLLD